MNVWVLIGIQFFVQFAFPALWPKRANNGVVTRACLRVWPFRGSRLWVRVKQVIALVPVYVLLPFPAGTIMVIALYLDDYLTGDEDDWRRRWEGVRNRVKWLMELPAEPSARGAS